MFAIKIELLTERYTATRFNDRNDTEWPPHPARLFSSLVAVWADTGADPRTRTALTWFEALDSPSIRASRAARRSPVTFYVPDADVGVAGAQPDRLYSQLTDKATQIAALTASISHEGTTPQRDKQLAKLVRELEKLRHSAANDSARRTAAKASESPDAIDHGLAVLPDNRTKQGRTFPTIIPDEPVVYFIWGHDDVPADHRRSLESLLHQVSRLGHSSSLVSCELIDDAPEANLVPDPGGLQQIRVTTAGLLDELEISFDRHRGNEPRSLPAVIQHYRLVSNSAYRARPRSVFGDSWTVLRVKGRPLPLSRTLALTVAVRGALQHHGQDPLPELLTGHAPSTDSRPTPPSSRPHLAIVPLPFVGREHADGGIRGVGLVFPTDASPADVLAIERALEQWTAASAGEGLRLQLGRAGIVELEVADLLTTPSSLRERTWCRPSATWVSTTPVALDRFARALWHRDPAKQGTAEQHAITAISNACSYIGLPRPRAVEILRAPPLSGVPGLASFPVYESPGRKVPRQSVHVRIDFHEPVVGPVLLGAGRYFGYGFCYPAGDVAAPSERAAAAEEVAR
jgi:CRISPR-associated protein Csb2